MPGLYSISVRAPGTLITADIYNDDHQNHVDGRAAEFMASYSTSVAQMNKVFDPLPPPGTMEALPTTFADELGTLRHEVAALKTGLSGNTAVNWYAPITTPALPVIGARIQRPNAQVIADSTNTAISFANGTADFNSGVWANTPNPQRFTAPTAGKYYAFCGVKWEAKASGRRVIKIGVNGLIVTPEAVTNTSNNLALSQFQSVAGLFNLAASDFIEFIAYQDSASPSSLSLFVNESQSVVGGIVFFGVNP